MIVGSVVPMVVEQDGRWERSFDIYSRLLRERIVFLGQEVEDGIAKARREGAHRKADRLAEWLDTLLHLYTDRILTLDVPIARVLAKNQMRLRRIGPSTARLAS